MSEVTEPTPRRINTRQKGLRGEREVALIYVAAGNEVRNLEREGDHLVVTRAGLIHSEAKWQGRLKLPEWWGQTRREAPAGSLPVLSVKIAGEWIACLPLDDLAELVAR